MKIDPIDQALTAEMNRQKARDHAREQKAEMLDQMIADVKADYGWMSDVLHDIIARDEDAVIDLLKAIIGDNLAIVAIRAAALRPIIKEAIKDKAEGMLND